MSRALAMMLSLLAVWIGLVQPSAAAASPTELSVAYNYSGHDQSALVTHPARKRGPPAVYDRATTCDAVDRWSDGASASPSAPTARAIHDYDNTALLARADSAPGTTNKPAWSYSGALSSFQRWQIAANTEASVVVTERTAAQALKPGEAVTRWDEFLGEGQTTNIHPRTGLPDPDRIVSADGLRSIRFGPHEMGSSPTKLHFHEETWSFDSGSNTWFVDQLLVRVPFPKGAW